MWLRRRVLIFYILCATALIVTIAVLNIITSDGVNDNFNFEKTSINFITYLSILSTVKRQNPRQILIHCDNPEFSGPYWSKLNQLKTNTSIKLVYLGQPTHVYGQRLSSIYHATDVARIQVLRNYGGIYFDSDVLVLNKLDKLRYYEMVVGLPRGDYMGTQILMANRNARFLGMWLEGYQHYQPRDWYYNAGRVPTKILKDMPYLAHKEEVTFGVQNLLDKLHSSDLWDDWKFYYTLHLLARHEPTPKVLNENVVQNLNTNFGDILRWILNL